MLFLEGGGVKPTEKRQKEGTLTPLAIIIIHTVKHTL